MRTLLITIFFCSLLACDNNATKPEEDRISPEQSEEEELYKAAIADHDEVMPKFSVIQKTQIELENYLEENEVEEELNNRIELANDNMEAANDAMMEWMAKISPPNKLRENKNHAEIIAFWQQMSREINEVKRQMEESLAAGEALLNEIEYPK